MSTLSFFPWFTVGQTIQFTQFRLLPLRRQGTNDHEISTHLTDIGNILANYKINNQRPVQSATILGLPGKRLTDDLTGEEIKDVFVYAEIVTLAGLATRRFFDHFQYSNAETFRAVVQRFQNSPDAPAITSRRRDGNTLAGFGAGLFQEICPFHVSAGRTATLDQPLIEAMLTAYSQGGDTWNHTYDATVAFNSANTDNNSVKQPIEVVLTLGAFERLLGLRGGREADLMAAFTTALSSVALATTFDETRVLGPALQTCANVREAWIRDFFRVRNDLAHGKRQAAYPSTWSAMEHLLLAAFIFPLTLKAVLASAGVYTITDDDRRLIFSFDHLANLNNTFALRDPQDPNSHPWGPCLGEARWAWAAVAAPQNGP